jgi:hypothetical protein
MYYRMEVNRYQARLKWLVSMKIEQLAVETYRYKLNISLYASL